MAITEPHSARHQPEPDEGQPPAAGPPVRRRRHPWRRRALITLGALLAAAVILAILAGTYQPVRFGEEAGIRFTGLPVATGVKNVNTFGNFSGDWYFPPQAGAFTLVLSLANREPQPVTIEAVSMAGPDQRAEQAQGAGPWPFIPAGRPLWLPLTYHPGQAGKPVADVSLGPDQDIIVGISLRMSSRCYEPGSFAHIDTFYVKERFLFFTRWVAVQFQPDMLIRSPAVSGQSARGLVCPAAAR